MTNLPKICTESTRKTNKCEYTECSYNIQHYDFDFDNYIICHHSKLEKMKRCMKQNVEMGENDG